MGWSWIPGQSEHGLGEKGYSPERSLFYRQHMIMEVGVRGSLGMPTLMFSGSEANIKGNICNHSHVWSLSHLPRDLPDGDWPRVDHVVSWNRSPGLGG